MCTQTLMYWLLASKIAHPRTVLQRLPLFPSIRHLFEASREELQGHSFNQKQIDLIRNPPWDLVEADLKWLQQASRHIITLDDSTYPPQLRQLSDAPLVLYVEGEVDLLTRPQVAMVGSRSASFIGCTLAKNFASALTEAGLAITSGLATGIDAASHEGALAATGWTIAVNGTGLLHVYPKHHQSLASKILVAGGAMVSEFPLDTMPKREHFPRRNRIIAGLSIGVLVVEAALKSGSLITARHALEQGKEIFAIPGPTTDARYRGCHFLIKQGAKLVETIEDILEEFPAWDFKHHPNMRGEGRPSQLTNLSSTMQQLLESIDYHITPMDVIILRSGLTSVEVSSMLLTLELEGCIVSKPGGYVRV